MRMDVTSLEILNYPVFIRIGCFDSEKLHGQEILISIDAQTKDTELDDVSATIDYGDILGFIDNLLHDKKINLIETVLNKIGSGLVENFRTLHSVTVTVEKTILPKSIAKGGKVRVKKIFYGQV